MITNGFVPVPRALFSDPFFSIEKRDSITAYLDLVSLVSFKPRELTLKGVHIKLEKGELACTILWLSKRWNRSRHYVRDFLNRLASGGYIEMDHYSGFTIVRILK